MRVALVAVVLAAGGCGEPGSVEIDATHPSSTAAGLCEDLVGNLPDTVADEDVRDVEPSNALGAAWGDPPIVLRCGVDKPAALHADSVCFVVNDVGWFASQDGQAVSGDEPVEGDMTWTTIGRAAYVEVVVPEDGDREPVAPLPDLADAVRKAIPEVQPCQ